MLSPEYGGLVPSTMGQVGEARMFVGVQRRVLSLKEKASMFESELLSLVKGKSVEVVRVVKVGGLAEYLGLVGLVKQVEEIEL